MSRGDEGTALTAKQDISGILADVIEAVENGHTIPVKKLDEILMRISNSAAPVNDVFIKFLKILFWYQQTKMLNYLFTEKIEYIINHCNEIKVFALFFIEPFTDLNIENTQLKVKLMKSFQKLLNEVTTNPYQTALVMTGLLELVSPGKTYLSYILERNSQILIPLFLNERYPLFTWLDSLGEQLFIELVNAFLQHDFRVSFSRDAAARCVFEGPSIPHTRLLDHPLLFCFYYLLRPVPSLPLPDTWVSQTVEYCVLFPDKAKSFSVSSQIEILHNWLMQPSSSTTLAKRYFAVVTARFLLNVLSESFDSTLTQQNYLKNVFNEIIEQLSDAQLLEGLAKKFKILLSVLQASMEATRRARAPSFSLIEYLDPDSARARIAENKWVSGVEALVEKVEEKFPRSSFAARFISKCVQSIASAPNLAQHYFNLLTVHIPRFSKEGVTFDSDCLLALLKSLFTHRATDEATDETTVAATVLCRTLINLNVWSSLLLGDATSLEPGYWLLQQSQEFSTFVRSQSTENLQKLNNIAMQQQHVAAQLRSLLLQIPEKDALSFVKEDYFLKAMVCDQFPSLLQEFNDLQLVNSIHSAQSLNNLNAIYVEMSKRELVLASCDTCPVMIDINQLRLLHQDVLYQLLINCLVVREKNLSNSNGELLSREIAKLVSEFERRQLPLFKVSTGLYLELIMSFFTTQAYCISEISIPRMLSFLAAQKGAKFETFALSNCLRRIQEQSISIKWENVDMAFVLKCLFMSYKENIPRLISDLYEAALQSYHSNEHEFLEAVEDYCVSEHYEAKESGHSLFDPSFFNEERFKLLADVIQCVRNNIHQDKLFSKLRNAEHEAAYYEVLAWHERVKDLSAPDFLLDLCLNKDIYRSQDPTIFTQLRLQIESIGQRLYQEHRTEKMAVMCTALWEVEKRWGRVQKVWEDKENNHAHRAVLEDKIARLRQKLREQLSPESQHKPPVATTDSEEKREVVALRQQCDRLKEKLDAQDKIISKLNKAKKSRDDALQAACDQQAADTRAAHARANSLQNERDAATLEISRLQTALHDLEEKLNVSTGKLAQAQQEFSSQEIVIVGLNARIQELQSASAQAFSSQEEVIVGLNARIEELDSAIAEAIEKGVEQYTTLLETEQNVVELKKQLAAAQSEIQALQQALQVRQDEAALHHQLATEYAALSSAIANLLRRHPLQASVQPRTSLVAEGSLFVVSRENEGPDPRFAATSSVLFSDV